MFMKQHLHYAFEPANTAIKPLHLPLSEQIVCMRELLSNLLPPPQAEKFESPEKCLLHPCSPMKRQQITPASLSSPAPNSARKGLHQYCTPQDWAAAIGAALPPHRRTIFDPFVGTGSLVRGLANDTTRDALGLDLDPTATLGGDKAWHRSHSSSGSVGSTKWRRSPAWSHFIAFVPECPTAFPPPPWRWQKTTIRPRYRAGIRDYAVTDRTRPETSIAG
jgi:hypothetical protein